MRVALRLPDSVPELGPEFTSAAAVAEIAIAAEAADFDAIFVTDHPIPSPDFERVGGHHSFDPFVALAYVAGVTERLRLLTFLTVLPYRNPFVTAKAIATLDVLSGGRAIFGCGVGYMREEFDALGIDFDARNDLADDAIDAIKKAWTGEPVFHDGKGFAAQGNVALPRPVQTPRPPIWVGGNSHRAIRRAVERGDAWMPFPASAARASVVGTAPMNDLDDLRRSLNYARAQAGAFGRTVPLEVVFMPLGRETYTEHVSPDRFVAAAAELASLGVTYFTTQLPAATRAELLDSIHRFGDEVLPSIASLEPSNLI
jgi:probable F420-dependent oxidoreductase